MNTIGAHTSTKDGIIEGIQYIQKIGGNTAQIFLGSNQSSSLKMKTKLTDEDCQEIKRYLEINHFKLFVHAVYVLNLSSFPSSSKRIAYAQNNVLYDLQWGYKMGIQGVVIHLGFQKTLTEQEAYENMADNIYFIVKQSVNYPVKILLETPAGSGSQIGTTIDLFCKLLEIIRDKFDDKKEFNNRIGVCLDTAHIFSSGYDIRTINKSDHYLNEFYSKLSKILKEPISLIHLNDSRAPLNSRRDIHTGIGEGYIFGEKSKTNNLKNPDKLEVLKSIIDFSNKYKIPVVLETHGAGHIKSIKDDGKYQKEIIVLKNFKNIEIKKNYIDYLKNSTQINNTRTKNRKNNMKKTHINKPSKNNKTKKIKLLNKKIIDTLTIVKNYYDVKGNQIKRNAYSRAIFHIKHYPCKINSGKQISHLVGIGPKMIQKIDTILESGTLPIIENKNMILIIKKAKNRPEEKFLSILGFGNILVEKIVKMGITNISELKTAVKQNKIKLTNQQQIGLKYYKELNKMVSREEAMGLHKKMDLIYNSIKTTKQKKILILPAGSFPSGKEESKDIDILLVKEDTNKINIEQIYDKYDENKDIIHKKFNFEILDVITKGKSNLMCIIKYDKNISHLDIKLCNMKELPFSYLHFTSGVELNKYMRKQANKQGYKLNDKGLFRLNNNKIINELKLNLDYYNYFKNNKMNKKEVIKIINENIEIIQNYIGLII